MRISDWSSDVCSSDLWPVIRSSVAMAAELRMTGQGLQQDGGAGARQAADEDRLHDLSVRDVGRPHPRLEVGEPDPQARMARDEAPAVMPPGGDPKALEAGLGAPGVGAGRRPHPPPTAHAA